jgi:hypothetical protein
MFVCVVSASPNTSHLSCYNRKLNHLLWYFLDYFYYNEWHNNIVIHNAANDTNQQLHEQNHQWLHCPLWCAAALSCNGMCICIVRYTLTWHCDWQIDLLMDHPMVSYEFIILIVHSFFSKQQFFLLDIIFYSFWFYSIGKEPHMCSWWS